MVPPKVEALVWQILLGKLAVKVELRKRGLLQDHNDFCVICNKESESVQHLFFQYHFSWRIWSRWLSLWGVAWCAPLGPIPFFQAWMETLPTGVCDRLWKMSFFAIVWSIWLSRNDVIFNRGAVIFDDLIQIMLLRVAMWTKAKWPFIVECVYEIIRNPQLITVKTPSVKGPRSALWATPSQGCMKFIVDGAAKGKPGPAGIGGVLRDDKGMVKLVFSKPVGVMDSNLAELLAAREAFIIYSDSQWAQSYKLLIESDSLNVVKWIKDPSSSPWRFRTIISFIENLKLKICDWSIDHVLREANSLADGLAKNGVYRGDELIAHF
ncbi:hypothetical protein PTKIN_Ptkin16aG0055800 [Pterospermum kingtungense]